MNSSEADFSKSINHLFTKEMAEQLFDMNATVKVDRDDVVIRINREDLSKM